MWKMKDKTCTHRDSRLLEKQEVYYCPDCGQTFKHDPHEILDDPDLDAEDFKWSGISTG